MGGRGGRKRAKVAGGSSPGSRKGDNEDGKGEKADNEASELLTQQIRKGETIPIVGELADVPFSCLIVGGMAIDNTGTRQRGVHDQSVCAESIRTAGWMYTAGTNMRVIELEWSKPEWAAEIEAGRIPQGTDQPSLLRLSSYEPEAHGMATIKCEHMKFRRFAIDDGSHRTAAMQQMIREGHPHAIDVCQRGIVLLNADTVEDRDVSVFSSIMANVRQAEVDKDFLADKLGQIKLVLLSLFHSVSVLPTPQTTYPHNR
jgi:hypothetical protein